MWLSTELKFSKLHRMLSRRSPGQVLVRLASQCVMDQNTQARVIGLGVKNFLNS